MENYVEVKLSSMGKLGLPAVIHVRDYTFDEASLFATVNDDTEEKVILEILKKVILEEVDETKITAQDAIEIFMTIQGTWYQSYVEKRYFINEDLEGDALTDDENISVAQIRVNDLPVKALPDNVCLPITIKKKGIELKLDYPRINHLCLAKEYINKKYSEFEVKINEIKNKIKNETASSSEIDLYAKYTHERETEFLKVLNGLLIISFNDEVPQTIEDKVRIFSSLTIGLIKQIDKVITENCNFGIQSEVTFKDDITDKMITRRFDFRIIDFLSSLESENESEYSVTFG